MILKQAPLSSNTLALAQKSVDVIHLHLDKAAQYIESEFFKHNMNNCHQVSNHFWIMLNIVLPLIPIPSPFEQFQPIPKPDLLGSVDALNWLWNCEDADSQLHFVTTAFG